MTSYLETYSKPIVTATVSIYDSNLIDSSRLLLNLYLYLKRIVTALITSLREKYNFSFIY